jgi:hypothetical protein
VNELFKSFRENNILNISKLKTLTSRTFENLNDIINDKTFVQESFSKKLKKLKIKKLPQMTSGPICQKIRKT